MTQDSGYHSDTAAEGVGCLVLLVAGAVTVFALVTIAWLVFR